MESTHYWEYSLLFGVRLVELLNAVNSAGAEENKQVETIVPGGGGFYAVMKQYTQKPEIEG